MCEWGGGCVGRTQKSRQEVQTYKCTTPTPRLHEAARRALTTSRTLGVHRCKPSAARSPANNTHAPARGCTLRSPPPHTHTHNARGHLREVAHDERQLGVHRRRAEVRSLRELVPPERAPPAGRELQPRVPAVRDLARGRHAIFWGGGWGGAGNALLFWGGQGGSLLFGFAGSVVVCFLGGGP